MKKRTWFYIGSLGLLLMTAAVCVRIFNLSGTQTFQRSVAGQTSEQTAFQKISVPQILIPAKGLAQRKFEGPDEPLDNPSTGALNRLLKNAEILYSSESVSDSDGHFTRLQILKTSFFYPMVRMKEHLRRDPETGSVELERTTLMVADHVLIQLQPGKGQSDLLALLSGSGAQIRRAFQFSGNYLVSFDGSQLNAIEIFMDRFKGRSEVIAKMTVDPIHLVHSEGAGL